uniref:Tegument protein UL37 n=1 Tax=Lemniscomys rat herpesvirus TaxID=3141920 RepID=A0AAU7E0A0_9VIRU
MTNRAVRLDALIDDVRSGSSIEEDRLLGTLAKMEVTCVQLRDVTASKIRQLLHLIPNRGSHFGFIHKYTIFYLLNHGTFGSTESRFSEIVDRLDELQKYADRNAIRTDVLLDDRTVVDTVRAFVTEAIAIQRSARHAAPVPSTHATVEEDRPRELAARVENCLTRTRNVINCRAVAELIEELYSSIFTWFNNTFVRELLRADGDGFLDNLLKIFYIYKYHIRTDDLHRLFSEIAIKHESELTPYLVTDLLEIQRTDSEHVRDLSFSIFTRSLSLDPHSSLTFPLLSCRWTTWNALAVENSFFHPGLIRGLLRLTDEERDSWTIDHRSAFDKNLRRFNDFCARLIEELFMPTNGESRTRQVPLNEILDRARRLYTLGLNPTTSKTYVKMICSNPRTAEEKSYGELSESEEHITLIIYNAYLFFTCLSRYNPTFLFHGEKRLLLEQQKSLLVGSQSRLETTWYNVTVNVNRFFHAWYGEQDFDGLTSGLTDPEKEYVYRDLTHKWGELLFPFASRAENLPQPHATTTTKDEIVEECVIARTSPDYHSYRTLVPLSTHREFVTLFAQHFVRPDFVEILGQTSRELRELDTLLRLTSACRILLPRQTDLRRSLVSLYNFHTYATETDIGWFKVICRLVNEVSSYLAAISGDRITAKSKLLEDLARRAFATTLDTTIAQSVRDAIGTHRTLLEGCLEHAKRCRAISECSCVLAFDPHRVIFVLNKQPILSVTMSTFVDSCIRLVDADAGFDTRLRNARRELDRLLARVEGILIEIRSVRESSETRFETSGLTRTFRKIEGTITDAAKLFSVTADRCRASTDELISAAKRIRGVVDVLRTNSLRQRGIRDCVIEATGLIASSTTSRRPAKVPEHDDGSISSASTPRLLTEPVSSDGRKIIDLLKDVFGDDDTQDSRQNRVPMSAQYDKGRINAYSDIFEERYIILDDVSQLKDWYVASKTQTETDITTPLRVRLIDDTS